MIFFAKKNLIKKNSFVNMSAKRRSEDGINLRELKRYRKTPPLLSIRDMVYHFRVVIRNFLFCLKYFEIKLPVPIVELIVSHVRSLFECKTNVKLLEEKKNCDIISLGNGTHVLCQDFSIFFSVDHRYIGSISNGPPRPSILAFWRNQVRVLTKIDHGFAISKLGTYDPMHKKDAVQYCFLHREDTVFVAYIRHDGLVCFLNLETGKNTVSTFVVEVRHFKCMGMHAIKMNSFDQNGIVINNHKGMTILEIGMIDDIPFVKGTPPFFQEVKFLRCLDGGMANSILIIESIGEHPFANGQMKIVISNLCTMGFHASNNAWIKKCYPDDDREYSWNENHLVYFWKKI